MIARAINVILWAEKTWGGHTKITIAYVSGVDIPVFVMMDICDHDENHAMWDNAISSVYSKTGFYRFVIYCVSDLMSGEIERNIKFNHYLGEQYGDTN